MKIIRIIIPAGLIVLVIFTFQILPRQSTAAGKSGGGRDEYKFDLELMDILWRFECGGEWGNKDFNEALGRADSLRELLIKLLEDEERRKIWMASYQGILVAKLISLYGLMLKPGSKPEKYYAPFFMIKDDVLYRVADRYGLGADYASARDSTILKCLKTLKPEYRKPLNPSVETIMRIINNGDPVYFKWEAYRILARDESMRDEALNTVMRLLEDGDTRENYIFFDMIQHLPFEKTRDILVKLATDKVDYMSDFALRIIFLKDKALGNRLIRKKYGDMEKIIRKLMRFDIYEPAREMLEKAIDDGSLGDDKTAALALEDKWSWFNDERTRNKVLKVLLRYLKKEKTGEKADDIKYIFKSMMFAEKTPDIERIEKFLEKEYPEYSFRLTPDDDKRKLIFRRMITGVDVSLALLKVDGKTGEYEYSLTNGTNRDILINPESFNRVEITVLNSSSGPGEFHTGFQAINSWYPIERIPKKGGFIRLTPGESLKRTGMIPVKYLKTTTDERLKVRITCFNTIGKTGMVYKCNIRAERAVEE